MCNLSRGNIPRFYTKRKVRSSENRTQNGRPVRIIEKIPCQSLYTSGDTVEGSEDVHKRFDLL